MINAYAIGVSIVVNGNAHGFLNQMIRDLSGAHVAADRLTGKLNAMKVAAVGAAAVFAGGAVLRGLWDMVAASKEFNNELSNTVGLGGAYAKNIAQIRQAAFNMQAAVPTSDPAGNVRLITDAAKQMNADPLAAIKLAPSLAKIVYTVSSATGENSQTIVDNLIKIVDLRAKLYKLDANGNEVKGADGKGIVDLASAQKELQYAAKALILNAPYVTSGGILAMFRQGQLPFKMMDADEAYGAAGEVAASGGGARTGTALQALYRQLIGGTMTKGTAEEMQRVGLLHPGTWSWAHGRLTTDKKTQAGFQKDMQRPFEFIEGPLSDLLDKDGFHGQAKIAEVMRLFGVATAQRLVTEIIAAHPQIDRTRTSWGLIPDANTSYQQRQDNNLDANITNLTSAWKGLMDSLGSAGTPIAIQVLKHLSTAIRDMTAWSEAHQQLAGNLIKLAAGMGALMIVLGGTAVVTAAIATLGALPLGIVGLATGILFLARAIDTVPGWLRSIGGPSALALGPVGAWILHQAESSKPADMKASRVPHYAGGQSDYSFTPYGRGSSPVPVVIQGTTPVHITNGGALGSALITGLAGAQSGPATGPTGGTTQYTPRVPGHN